MIYLLLLFINCSLILHSFLHLWNIGNIAPLLFYLKIFINSLCHFQNFKKYLFRPPILKLWLFTQPSSSILVKLVTEFFRISEFLFKLMTRNDDDKMTYKFSTILSWWYSLFPKSWYLGKKKSWQQQVSALWYVTF